VPEPQFEEVLGAFTEAIPKGTLPELRKNLRRTLGWANGYSLRTRLKWLLRNMEPTSVERIIGQGGVPRFVHTVVTIRNYLIHYDDSRKLVDVDSTLEMFNLNLRLRALIVVFPLQHLGLDEKVASTALDAHLGLAFD
jgi:hypothetical protein